MTNPQIGLISKGNSFIVTIDGEEIPATKCLIVIQQGSIAEVVLHIPSEIIIGKLESECTIIQDSKPGSL